MIERTTNRLLELSEQKLAILTSLRNLSTTQEILVREQGIDELLPILSRKSEVIEDLRGVQSELAEFANDEPTSREWKSQSDRETCRSNFAKCDQLLSELLQLEESSLNDLSTRRDLVGQQLQQFSGAHAIADAYRTSEFADDEQPTLSLDG